MKILLKYQNSEYDCGPTSFINALAYLYDREEIPAELIKAVYTYTLDCFDQDGNMGQGGTSRDAIKYLTYWIKEFSIRKNFDILCDRLEKSEVNYKNIFKSIKNNGVVFIRSWLQKAEHYILITNIDKDAPEVELSINGENLVIGTGKDTATIKSKVKVSDKNSVEIKYIYSNNEILTDDEKAELEADFQKSRILRGYFDEAAWEESIKLEYRFSTKFVTWHKTSQTLTLFSFAILKSFFTEASPIPLLGSLIILLSLTVSLGLQITER